LQVGNREDSNSMNRALIAGVVVVVLIGGVLLAGYSPKGNGSTPTGNDPKPPANGGNGKVQVQRPVKVVIECETYVRIEDKEPGGKVVIRKGSSTEGTEITFLETPDGCLQESGLGTREKTGGAQPGKVFYEFEVPRDGTYYLFLRAQWYDNCGDSVYLRVNDGAYQKIEDTEGRVSEVSYMWAWHPLRHQGKMKGLELKAGKQTLELNVREDGPKFDKILIASDATPPAPEEVNP